MGCGTCEGFLYFFLSMVDIRKAVKQVLCPAFCCGRETDCKSCHFHEHRASWLYAVWREREKNIISIYFYYYYYFCKQQPCWLNLGVFL